MAESYDVQWNVRGTSRLAIIGCLRAGADEPCGVILTDGHLTRIESAKDGGWLLLASTSGFFLHLINNV